MKTYKIYLAWVATTIKANSEEEAKQRALKELESSLIIFEVDELERNKKHEK